jgi:serine/threonine protein kinase
MAHAPLASSGERDASARYERLATLGSGGVGTVYRARQLPLEREVALKEIRELFSMFGDEQRREIVRRFGEVVRAAAQLAHPNIVTLHDVSTEREYPFVVSELMPAGSVRRLIADAEDLPVTLVMKYLLQVLQALRAAHAQGVLHRGLKPENLLVDPQGNVQVSDFGFARIVERDQVIRQVYVGMGAVAYMAPEMFTDPASAGPHVDIYALGIVFYEMLTRKVPGRRSPMPSQVNPGLPKGIDEIFDKMTRDDRADRYASVEQIIEDFDKLDGMKAFIEAHHVALFVENPVSALRLRAPTAPTTVTDVPVVPRGETAVVVDPAPPTIPDDKSQAALGRRPYSYQQRLKNKSE